MAVDNISLGMQYLGYSHEGYNGILFHQYEDARQGDRGVRIVFSTQEGPNLNASFQVFLTYFGHRKGGLAQTSPQTTGAVVPNGEAHHVLSGGRHWWSIPLEGVFPGATGSGWTFSGRAWDGLELDITIICNWSQPIEGMRRSARYSRTCYINYVPTYTLQSAYINQDGALQISYTATDWGRNDDRWGVDSMTVDGKTAIRPNTFGTVAGYGTVIVPASAITRDVTHGKLALRLRFNAAWRPASMAFATISSQQAGTSDPHQETKVDPGVKVNDWSKVTPETRAYACNDPVISVVGVGEEGACFIRVRVADSGNLGKPITHAIVKLEGAKYSFDSADIKVGGEGIIDLPPLGVPFKLFGYGLDGSGGVSDGAVADVDPIEADGTIITLVDDTSNFIELKHQKAGSTLLPSVTTEANTEKVQLSGRRRQSVYFGESGTTSVKFSGVLVQRLGDSDGRDLEEFPEQGVFMCRFTDGRRYAVSGSVSIEPDVKGDYKASIDAEEVDV